MRIRFLLNGDSVECDAPPTATVLDWLRETRGLTGTKEGCNEGDCGACTVMVTDAGGVRALNACILFMGQLDGRAVRTIEGIGGPDDRLHPVQRALVEHHASQCGFCTPGFVVAMAVAHRMGARDHDDQLAGNLCRCTGYAPILRAAAAAAADPVPDWMHDTPPPAAANAQPPMDAGEDAPPDGTVAADWGARAPLAATGADTRGGPGTPARAWRPRALDAFAAWYADHPEATLVAGATDVGLWVTKGLRELGTVCFLGGIHELRRIEIDDDRMRIGAGATLAELRQAVAPHHPAFAELIRRFGSTQVRNAATIGGNIANGSPIGDGAPALIALGATLTLRRGDARRDLPLEDFFLDYGRQDRAPGEFVESIQIPRQADGLSCQKVSKRFDQDISAVCGCFNIARAEGRIVTARVAFGGMAATPRRARRVEAALVGRQLDARGVAPAMQALEEEFEPISDMRASAAYRLDAARGMIARLASSEPSILEVAP